MDVLYFYHILLLLNNKVMDLGHKFHYENVFDSFNLLIQDNKENKDSELFTFIAGLITHYIADSIMHPYINYLANSESKTARFNTHFKIETYLDNYYINEKMHVNPIKYNNTKFVFNYTKSDIVKNELTKVYQVLFNYPNMGDKYYKALRDMKFVFNYIRYDPFGIKKILYQIIDLNPFKKIPRVRYLSYNFDLDNDEYYLNLNHQEWFNIDKKDLVSNKSFLDLYQDVLKEASYIINELYEYIFNEKETDLKKLIKNNSYANGLPISPHR